MLVRETLSTKRAPVTIGGEQLILDAMQCMVEEDIGSLIVVNEHETPIGIITESDIFSLAYRKQGQIPDLPVKDHMSTDLIMGMLDDELDFIAEVMIKNNIQHIPIMDETEKLCGIISMRDVVRMRLSQTASRQARTVDMSR